MPKTRVSKEDDRFVKQVGHIDFEVEIDNDGNYKKYIKNGDEGIPFENVYLSTGGEDVLKTGIQEIWFLNKNNKPVHKIKLSKPIPAERDMDNIVANLAFKKLSGNYLNDKL